MKTAPQRIVLLFAVIAAPGLWLPGDAARAHAAVAPRVISLYAAHTEMLLRLGAREQIIGVSKQETYDGPETAGWRPAAFSIRDDVEKFLAARPDIVLMRPQHAAGNPHMIRALEAAGIRLYVRQVTRADELYDYWRELAEIVGRESAAETLIAEFDAEIRRYEDAAAAFGDRPGVFLEAIHREVKTFTPDSIPVWLMELAGGRNVARDAAPTTPGVIIAAFGPERVLARAAEIELFIAQDGAMNRTPLAVIQERDIYQPLKAFAAGNVHKIPEAYLSRPTPSLLEGLRIMANWTGLAQTMPAEE